MVGRIEAFCLSESHALTNNAALMVEVIIHEEPKNLLTATLENWKALLSKIQTLDSVSHICLIV